MTLKIKIHDVGHGQAVHVFTPNGQTIVIDLVKGSSLLLALAFAREVL